MNTDAPNQQDIVRVKFCSEANYVGPLWGLFFQENNLSDPILRGLAEMVIHRSGNVDSHRLLQVIEVNQDPPFEPIEDQPKPQVVEIPQALDLGEVRRERERKKPPVVDCGVPSYVEPPPETEAPPAPPVIRSVATVPRPVVQINYPAPVSAPALASALLDEEPSSEPPTKDLKSEVVAKTDLVEPPATPAKPETPVTEQVPPTPVPPQAVQSTRRRAGRQPNKVAS